MAREHRNMFLRKIIIINKSNCTKSETAPKPHAQTQSERKFCSSRTHSWKFTMKLRCKTIAICFRFVCMCCFALMAKLSRNRARPIAVHKKEAKKPICLRKWIGWRCVRFNLFAQDYFPLSFFLFAGFIIIIRFLRQAWQFPKSHLYEGACRFGLEFRFESFVSLKNKSAKFRWWRWRGFKADSVYFGFSTYIQTLKMWIPSRIRQKAIFSPWDVILIDRRSNEAKQSDLLFSGPNTTPTHFLHSRRFGFSL